MRFKMIYGSRFCACVYHKLHTAKCRKQWGGSSRSPSYAQCARTRRGHSAYRASPCSLFFYVVSSVAIVSPLYNVRTAYLSWKSYVPHQDTFRVCIMYVWSGFPIGNPKYFARCFSFSCCSSLLLKMPKWNFLTKKMRYEVKVMIGLIILLLLPRAFRSTLVWGLKWYLWQWSLQWP